MRHPDKDPAHPSFADEDHFSYIANDEDNDRYGERCPFGSHVRRVNPRDWGLDDSRDKSLELANLHRILRRGRPYGEPFDAQLSVEKMVEAARRGSQPNAGEHARAVAAEPAGHLSELLGHGSASGTGPKGNGHRSEHGHFSAQVSANGQGANGHANGQGANGHANGSGSDVRRGLQFLCFNSNIDRQFEFIQQQWCNNPKFAGLSNDPDPLSSLAKPSID